MSNASLGVVLQHLRTLVDADSRTTETDGQLLGRFTASRDEAAFAALLGRHGPMVLGVCRRVLPSVHDAEDIFQATFLLLARKPPPSASKGPLAAGCTGSRTAWRWRPGPRPRAGASTRDGLRP
jgi:hypothetical protein